MNEDLYYEEDIREEEEEGIDFNRYIQIFWKRKWLILAIFVIITVPWFFYVKSLPPTYEAFCDIEFRSLEGENQNLITESRIIKLRSRSFAEKVVAQLGLTLSLDSKDQKVNRHQLFEEFHTNQNPKSGDYVFEKKNDGTYTIHLVNDERRKLIHQGSVFQGILDTVKTNAGFTFQLAPDLTNVPDKIEFRISMFKLAVQSFRSRTNVGFQGPNILRLTMSDTDPVLVAKMVNSLAEIYVEESMSLKRSSVEDRRKIIENKLRIAEKQLAESEKKLKEFKSTHLVSIDAETDDRVSRLNESEEQLESYKKQIDALDELLGKLRLAIDSEAEKNRVKYVYRQLASLPTFDSNYKMGALKNQLLDQEDEYEQLVSSGLTKKHKKAIELEKSINNLQQEIKSEAIAHRGELKKETISLQSTISNLKYNLKQKLPEDQFTMMVLERELRANEEIYRQLKAQSQLANISEAVENEIVEILDPALVPDYPVNRDKKKKAVMGAMFALALGFGVALGLDFLDKSIKTVDDVKKYLKMNVLGTIPNIEFKDIGDHQDSEKIKQIDQQLVTYDYSPTPIGEAYRSLRTNLVFSKSAGRIQSFVITSTSPGDGKSFTAANLAISIAQQKNNTLLIDADLRRGVLHNTYGVPKEPGFTNYLTNMATFNHVVNETMIPNLSLISCGSLLPNPSELLGSNQMKRFLDEAKRKFDIVIFDSPPLNAATDAIVIGTQVDSVVVVIRSGVTNRKIAKQKLELFRNVPARVLGIILNGTSAEFGHDGYSYYHY
ncbi:polysaccharide biosynthesis tyrosine autokinase [candidate division KSB1 bacterium]|nr:polysaccharide biosynthesis tyrosine autokinase [candidate division KSB1 bacterium]